MKISCDFTLEYFLYKLHTIHFIHILGKSCPFCSFLLHLPNKKEHIYSWWWYYMYFFLYTLVFHSSHTIQAYFILLEWYKVQKPAWKFVWVFVLFCLLLPFSCLSWFLPLSLSLLLRYQPTYWFGFLHNSSVETSKCFPDNMQHTDLTMTAREK